MSESQYSIKRSGSIFNQSAQHSDQELIAELDSAMNNWMDSVPSHCTTDLASYVWPASLIPWYSEMASKWQQRTRPQTISCAARNLLPSSDLHSSTVHTFSSEPYSRCISFSGNMYQCRALVLSCSWIIHSSKPVAIVPISSELLPVFFFACFCVPNQSFLEHRVHICAYPPFEHLEWKKIRICA